jgi:hypothetical protein
MFAQIQYFGQIQLTQQLIKTKVYIFRNYQRWASLCDVVTALQIIRVFVLQTITSYKSSYFNPSDVTK